MENINLPPFYVGQKVVCINNKPLPNRTNSIATERLVEGKEYIVSKIDPVDEYSVVPLPTISVRGVIGFFCVSRFAPIQENFQSISLEKILEKETELISSN